MNLSCQLLAGADKFPRLCSTNPATPTTACRTSTAAHSHKNGLVAGVKNSEWIPVFSSALAVGFLSALFFTPATKPFLWLCAAVLVLQAVVGVAGFVLHN